MGGSEDDMILAVKISPAEGPFFVSPSFVSCVTHFHMTEIDICKYLIQL